MQLPVPRGPISASLIDALRSSLPLPPTPVPASIAEDDLQISLWTLYELHYRGFEEVDADREWDPDLIRLRSELEKPFEATLRTRTRSLLDHLDPEVDVVTALEQLTAPGAGVLARYLHREASASEFRDYLAVRSLYHLKEADPHTWVLPRLEGAPKVALAELQYDEYGGGVPARLHQQLYADALAAAGLDPTYGAYLDITPAHVLAVNNVMSLFGLHRRLRGAAMGHLAAFEMTSSVPCRKIAGGAARLDLGEAVARYFDEHVEADAVHEHVASRSICGALVTAEPELRDDVLFGAAACLALDEVSGEQTVAAWRNGETATAGRGDRDAA